MENSPASGADRRRFLKLLAVAGMSSTLAGPSLPVADSAPLAKAQPPNPPAPSDSAATATKQGPSEDAQALAGIIRRRYGQHLDEGQLGKVTEDLDDVLQLGKNLRAVKLGNHEEPDFTFRA